MFTKITVLKVWTPVLLLSLLSISTASARSCDFTLKPVSPRSDFGKAIDSAFQQHASVRRRPVNAQSRAVGSMMVRNCSFNQGNTQEVSVRYRGTGIVQGARSAKTYTCGSTFMRYQYYRGRWSDWRHLKTGCGPATLSSNIFEDRLPTSEYIPGGNASESPDDVYDPDYRDRRGGGGGPDDVDDGEGSRDTGGDEFGDLYH